MGRRSIRFQERALAVIRRLYPDHLVIANACAKSHDHGAQFPSIPFEASDEFIAQLKRIRKGKKSIMHKPDIAVLDYGSISRVWLQGKRYPEDSGHTFSAEEWRAQFEGWIGSGRFLNSKGQPINTSIFDESVPSKVEHWWEWTPGRKQRNSTKAAIILKRGRGFHAVADAKDYQKAPIGRLELEKLEVDATFLAATSCMLVIPSKARLTGTASERTTDLQERSVPDDIRILVEVSYQPPTIIDDRDAFRERFRSLMGRRS